MGEKLGFIGLGKMGLPLSENLIGDGHEVSGYDIDPVRRKIFKEMGGRPANTSREVAECSDIIFTTLLKPEHIEENVLGSTGIVSAGKEGLILIEMSTMHPDWSASLAANLNSRKVYMVDAPVSGSVPHVKSRTLSYMVGGEKEVYNRILPVIGPLANNVTYTG